MYKGSQVSYLCLSQDGLAMKYSTWLEALNANGIFIVSGYKQGSVLISFGIKRK